MTNDVRCVAYGQKKKLQIFFHRNSSKDDTEMDVQTMTYGWKSAFGKYRVENERKKTGWMGNEAGCKKSRLKMWGSGKGQLDNQIQSEN